MNAAWNFRTHDQPYGISWARFLLASTGSAWTIENGTYPGNWLGLWTVENGYTDGEELACNKQGEDIGRFQIFAIKKATFHHQWLADKTEGLPVDATVLIQNPDFTGNSWVLWAVTGTFGNQRFNGAAETWHSTDFTMQQTLTGLLAGRYTVSCQMANGEGSNTGYLFATSNGTTEKAVVSQSCVGSNFDAERDRMAANANYGLLSVDVEVGDDGRLTFGIVEPTNGTTWLVFDNFRLTFKENYLVGIDDVADPENGNRSSFYYDLSGRPMGNLSDFPISSKKTSRGGQIYIINGHKVLIK